MRLLILGTGGMANQHARNFSAIKDVSVVGGVDVVPERLAAFCAEHKIGRQFASIEDALAWGEFDAVANVTPDRVHHPTTMHAIAAGKHVFCEKPLATDATKAMEMTEAIGKAGLVGMVNFTYRNSPALQKGRQMVLDGADRRGPPCRGLASPELARRQGVGRLEERKQMALAALQEARLERRARRHRHPYRRLCVLRLGARRRACLRSAENVRQGAGQQDRRVRSRRQRQLLR